MIRTIDKKIPILSKYIDERTGYLHIKAKVSRDGLQEYLGMELSEDLEPLKTYNVYRPTEEVTKQESLDTIINAPVTIEHPSDFVTKDNSKDLTKGVGLNYNITKDGDTTVIESELIITDKEAIKAIENGKKEISLGYEQNMVKEDGEYQGKKYQFKQTDIRVNHIALVDAGRCGDKCKITIDNNAKINHIKKTKGESMPTITIDSVTHEVTDCVAKHISSLTSKLSDMEAEKEQTKKDMEKLQAEKDMSEEEKKKMQKDMEESKKKTSDSAINDAIATKLKLVDTAKKLNVDCKVTDSNESIIDSVISSKYPNISLDGKSEAYKQALMDAISQEMEKEDEEKKKKDEKHQMSEDAATKDFKSNANDADIAIKIQDKKASMFTMPNRK